jgi:hypothetical protein
LRERARRVNARPGYDIEESGRAESKRGGRGDLVSCFSHRDDHVRSVSLTVHLVLLVAVEPVRSETYE